MKNVLLFPIFTAFTLVSSSLRCNPQDNCRCFPGQPEFEFQCPSDFEENGEFVIHIQKEKEILIDCTLKSETFKTQLLPNITLNKINKFRLRFCPLPKNGFGEIFQHFSIEQIKYFQYGSFNISNTTLKKEDFASLEELDSLQLNALGLVHLNEDVFLNIPKLSQLELQLNQIILQQHLFHTVVNLKMLDISENGLKEIPNKIFERLSQLQLLYLWGNNLKRLNDETLHGLINLKSLELSFNQIEEISEGAFKTLVNLVKINLTSNKIKILFSTIFSQNRNLELIKLKNNRNLQISNYTFANLPKLEQVDLTNCSIDMLPDDAFENSTNIQILNLSFNNLDRLSEKLFANLKNLKQLRLARNKLEKIGSVFGILKNLKVLNLERNLITAIFKEDFQELNNLEEINLARNQIKTIHNFAFNNNGKLKRLDLSFNKYSGDYNSHLILLENVPSLERVDLSNNRIVEIGNVITLYNKVHLQLLDLSNNFILNISIKDLQPLSPQLKVNLKNNNITFVNFDSVNEIITENMNDAYSGNNQPQTTILLQNNPLECDCYNYDLVKYFQYELEPPVRAMFEIISDKEKCANPPILRHFSIEDVPQTLLVCDFGKLDENDACPENCSCFWRPSDTCFILDCSNQSLTEFPEISKSQIRLRFNQTELHLEDNKLQDGPNKNLTGYENITKLFLSNNLIEKLEWIPPKIEVLHLDQNKIKQLDYQVLNMLNTPSLFNLTFEENPFECDCNAVNLTNFLRQKTKVIDARRIKCGNDTRLLINLNRRDLCDEFELAGIAIGFLLFLLVIAILIVVYYRNQQAIKVWLYAHDFCLWWVTEEELDKEKIYDAFISYSHKDEEFVVQNLLPVLESGPNPYKLCIHIRNFIPGEFIATQVTNSVYDSRRTLVVLSKNFLESVWGKLEFRTAHTQAMTEGRARVILVLYGDVENEDLDEELRSYMKTNTYIKWGDPYFWNKLRYALPHSNKTNSHNKQKIANVMSCIDDKFSLVAPVTPSAGTTPPVLNLDSNGLKKHPLNFLTDKNQMDTPPAESGTLLTTSGL